MSIEENVVASEESVIAGKENELLESLRDVIDPEIGMNIVELGLIRNVEVNDESNSANVTMILTTPFCPYGPQLIEQVRLVGGKNMAGGCNVELGTELWDPSMMEEGAGGDWGLF